MDKMFEIRGGDIVRLPIFVLLAQLKTSAGELVMQNTTYFGTYEDTRLKSPACMTSNEWMKHFDEYYGAKNWTLFRRISDTEWESLIRWRRGE